jgi:uncharacterized protein (DUF2062 family)
MYNSYYRKAWNRDMRIHERRRLEKQARREFWWEMLAIGVFSGGVAVLTFFVLSI